MIMNKIQRNKHPAGRLSNIIFGFCTIADGCVRVISLGFLHTTLTLDWSRNQAKKAILNLKRNYNG